MKKSNPCLAWKEGEQCHSSTSSDVVVPPPSHPPSLQHLRLLPEKNTSAGTIIYSCINNAGGGGGGRVVVATTKLCMVATPNSVKGFIGSVLPSLFLLYISWFHSLLCYTESARLPPPSDVCDRLFVAPYKKS